VNDRTAMERRANEARRSFFGTLEQLRKELTVMAVLNEIAHQADIRYGLLGKARNQASRRPVIAGATVLAFIAAVAAYQRRPLVLARRTQRRLALGRRSPSFREKE
jgi:hypothetical protein